MQDSLNSALVRLNQTWVCQALQVWASMASLQDQLVV
jgi:hypothetical protein